MYRFTWLILVFVILAVGQAFADTTNRVPDSSVVFVRIARMQDDPGVSWLSSSWFSTNRKGPVRAVMGEGTYREASVVVLQPGPEGQRIGMIVEMSARPDTTALDTAIAADGVTETRTVSGITVTYAPNPLESEDFAAYAVNDATIVLGSDSSVVAEIMNGSAMNRTAAYRQVGSRVDVGSDGLIFADNDGLRFADFLAPLEQKWQMSLLLSAMDLEWMASGFDVVDSNRVTGKIVFKGSSEAAVPDISDDAEFLGETFRRKFAGEQIDYTSNVTVDGTVVTLDFSVQGLEPLWLRLFENGVLSVIRPE